MYTPVRSDKIAPHGASKVPKMHRIGDLLIQHSEVGHWCALIVTHSVVTLEGALEYLRWLNLAPGAEYTVSGLTIATGITRTGLVHAGMTIGPIENDQSTWEVIR